MTIDIKAHAEQFNLFVSCLCHRFWKYLSAEDRFKALLAAKILPTTAKWKNKGIPQTTESAMIRTASAEKLIVLWDEVLIRTPIENATDPSGKALTFANVERFPA
jgi:hypothetical protein